MFTSHVIRCTLKDENSDKMREEFWRAVYRAHGRALQRIPHGNCLAWREAKSMLSQHGWVDMTYFNKKENPIYVDMLEEFKGTVRSMRTDEGQQFINCMWMMDTQLRDHITYTARNPQSYFKLFVLLPAPEKAEIFLLDNSCRIATVCFIAIYFPSVFPKTGTWPNAPQNACILLKQHYRKEIVDYVDEYRRITLDSPDSPSSISAAEVMSTIRNERWNRLNKIYLIMFRQSGEAWREYVNYLREKGFWID